MARQKDMLEMLTYLREQEGYCQYLIQRGDPSLSAEIEQVRSVISSTKRLLEFHGVSCETSD